MIKQGKPLLTLQRMYHENISCQNCEYDRDCFQYKRNRKSECIDREYYYWKRVNIEKLCELWEVMLMPDFWTSIKNVLNEYLSTGEKRRKDIVTHMQRGMQVSVDNSTGAFLPRRTIHGYSFNTFNTYLNILTKAGWLYRPRRGIYGLVTEIPSDLSVDDCKLQAYGELIGIAGVDDYKEIMRVVKSTQPYKDFISKEEMTI